MSAPRVERRRIRTVRVEMPGGRVLRAAIYLGEPDELLLRASAPAAPPGGRTEDALSLPATALLALRRLLMELDPEDDDQRDG